MRVSISEIFSKLFPGDTDAAVRAIFSAMETKTAIVHFLYFANAERCGLFRSEKRSDSDESYFRALLSADLLLPDGVALALSHLRFKRPELSALPTLLQYQKFADSSLRNLNGTDFLPKFLSAASERF
jgi:UDP-N-acetyl-D-mannosaminuronic acid transferase (WecB/TagA/CpsF family)